MDIDDNANVHGDCKSYSDRNPVAHFHLYSNLYGYVNVDAYSFADVNEYTNRDVHRHGNRDP